MTFLVVAATRSSGGVFTDPSLPVQDVHATIGSGSLGAGHTLGLFTRTALILVLVPYAHGTASGRIEEATREVTRTGWADARVKLSVNLVGGRALTAAEFARAPRAPIVGVSLTAVMPTGQYRSDRLINLGSHRWSWKPEAGVSVPVGRWLLDAYAGVWLFGANDEYFPGQARRTQDPVVTIQGHVSYTIRPRLWLAFNATWYSGGTSAIDGVEGTDLQRNSRVGGAISVPIARSQSLKFSASTGATTRIGGDFNTFSIAWQIAWIR